eukprot:1820492-Amphidinium_carterae.1
MSGLLPASWTCESYGQVQLCLYAYSGLQTAQDQEAQEEAYWFPCGNSSYQFARHTPCWRSHRQYFSFGEVRSGNRPTAAAES